MFKKFFKKSKKEEIKEEASQVVVSEETVEEQAEKLQVEEEQQVEEVQKVEKPKEEVVKEVALDSSVEDIQNEELQLVEDKKEIEEILITADVGVDTTMNIIDKLTDAIKTKKITDPQDVKGELKLIIEEILTNENSTLDVSHSPSIIIMVGVNGVGKTTTIGKLASRYKKEGKKVLIAAGDTFRAAAIDQL